MEYAVLEHVTVWNLDGEIARVLDVQPIQIRTQKGCTTHCIEIDAPIKAVL